MVVRWVAFPLHPETPREGRTLESLFAGRDFDLPAMRRRLVQIAAELELPFGDRTMTYNSRLAQELGKWAESEGKGDAYHQAAFKAYFADGKNLALEQTLIEMVDSIGLSAGRARRVLSERPYRTAVDQDWAYSRKIGITAVPSFGLNNRLLVGAQPFESLARFVEAALPGKTDQ